MDRNGTEEQRHRSRGITPGYLEVILISLLVVGGGLYGYDRFIGQKIRVVDLQGYLRQQKSLMAAGTLSSEQLQSSLDRVDQVIRQEVDRNRNHVVLLKEVVLGNAEEIDIR